MAISVRSGKFQEAEGFNYVLWKYPKGSIFLWVTCGLADIDNLAVGTIAGVPAVPTSTVLMESPEGANACSNFAKKLSRKIGFPCFVSIPEIADLGTICRIESEVVQVFQNA